MLKIRWMGTRQLLFSVEKGRPLSPLLFAINLNSIESVADGVEGALTASGTPEFLATHMLFAVDPLVQ